jgi:hypothetical protein
MAIVAMPIAIVTSWVLYERCKVPSWIWKIGHVLITGKVVLGEERKNLVKPGMAVVETPAAAEGKGDGTPSTST